MTAPLLIAVLLIWRRLFERIWFVSTCQALPSWPSPCSYSCEHPTVRPAWLTFKVVIIIIISIVVILITMSHVTMSPCHDVSQCHKVRLTCERVRLSWHGTVCHCHPATLQLLKPLSQSGNCTTTLISYCHHFCVNISYVIKWYWCSCFCALCWHQAVYESDWWLHQLITCQHPLIQKLLLLGQLEPGTGPMANSQED